MTQTAKTLYAEADDANGQISWSLDDKTPPAKNQKKTIHYPQGSGEYNVTIQFKDNTGRGLGFKTADPIWVQEGGSCPPQAGVNSTQIPSTSIAATATSLQFTNLNGKKCDLIYQLNFVDAQGHDASPQLDPEFKNGGGGTRYVSYAIAAAAGVGLIALAMCSMGKLAN